MNNIENIIINPTPDTHEDNVYHIGHNIDITVGTVDGYFIYTNKNIKIKKRSSNQVVFMLPFGISEVTINTKDNENNIVAATYRAD